MFKGSVVFCLALLWITAPFGSSFVTKNSAGGRTNPILSNERRPQNLRSSPLQPLRITESDEFSHDAKEKDDKSDSSSVSWYLATCIPGLATALSTELLEMEHSDIFNVQVTGQSAVRFQATREGSLVALCWLKTAHRLLEEVAVSSHPIYDRADLLSFVKEDVNVPQLLGDGQGGLLTISVKAVLNNPKQLPQDLAHSHFTALTIKNALCDVTRDLRGDRPDVDVESPDVPLVVICHGERSGPEDSATVTLYRSLHPPGSLHKRGYRQGAAMHKAAMKESLAAGLLIEAGWQHRIQEAKQASTPNLRLVDPMAGSGSLVLEAAMMAANIAPALMRIRCGLPDHSMPPVTKWKVGTTTNNDGEESKSTTADLWKAVLVDANQKARQGLMELREHPEWIRLQANDIHPGAIQILKSSLEAAGLSNIVSTETQDCYDLKLMDEDNDEEEHGDGDDNKQSKTSYLVVTNPPWGIRLTEDIEDSWEGLRHYIRDTCPSGTQVWVLSGDKSSTKLLKLRRDRMVPIQTGDQTLRWIQYTIGSGGGRPSKGATHANVSSSSRATVKEDSW